MPTIPPPNFTRDEGHEPQTPLSQIANEGMRLIEQRLREAGLPGDSIVVLIDSGNAGATAMHRADGDSNSSWLLAALLIHARAVARANGSDLDMLAVPGGQG